MNFFSALFYYRDKKSPDKLGRYPQRFHITAIPERRYLWTSRILVIFAVLSFCLMIMLILTLYLLLGQKASYPALLRSNSDKSALERVNPNIQNISFIDLLTEQYIGDYIKMRHAIPRSSADLFYRWDKNSKFYWFSSHSVYYDFVGRMDNRQLRRFIKLKMKRLIEIDKIQKISGNLWLAQFRTSTTTKDMPEPDVIIWRAYIRIKYLEFTQYEKLEKSQEEKINYTTNPFGFKVINYSLAYAGKPEKADDYLTVAKKVFGQVDDVVK